MKNEKSFVYLGLTFMPLRKYSGDVLDKINLYKDGIFPDGYNHEEFYKVASKNGCGNYDTFIITYYTDSVECKRSVIPCNNGFHFYNQKIKN